jgi:hypothetical protein
MTSHWKIANPFASVAVEQRLVREYPAAESLMQPVQAVKIHKLIYIQVVCLFSL